MDVRAYVHEAELALDEATDPAAVGAAVTVALCGHWEHDGPCRWPHNNNIEERLFRTIFVAAPDEEHEVRDRIRGALNGGAGWRVQSDHARPVAPEEAGLAARLANGPRRPKVNGPL